MRDDFKPESDVDVLVAFAPNARWSLLDLARMQDELSSLWNRPVDLVTRRAVERSQNWIRRKAILESAEVQVVAWTAWYQRLSIPAPWSPCLSSQAEPWPALPGQARLLPIEKASEQSCTAAAEARRAILSAAGRGR